MDFASLLTSYASKRTEIEKRLHEFKAVMKRPEEELFAEMVFCILTPQSKAHACDKAVKELFSSGAVFSGNTRKIAEHLKSKVRFHKTKAGHIVKARLLLDNGGIKNKLVGDPIEIREWLVENVYGMGYKEASHFLRNIGMGKELAILDRHILKNLVKHGVIKNIPKSMTKKRYMVIEEKMKEFSNTIGIPLAHLDLLLWSQETGEIFK